MKSREMGFVSGGSMAWEMLAGCLNERAEKV